MTHVRLSYCGIIPQSDAMSSNDKTSIRLERTVTEDEARARAFTVPGYWNDGYLLANG